VTLQRETRVNPLFEFGFRCRGGPTPRAPARRYGHRIARKRPDDETLRRFAEFEVLNEVRMIRGLTVKLMNRHHREDHIVEIALLNGFLMYTRAVYEFLYTDEPRYDTDAVASDYFDDDTWSRERPEPGEHLVAVPGRAGKRVAHLSYKRLEPDEGTVVLGIGPEILGTLAQWAHMVPPDRIPTGWLDDFDEAAGALPDGWEAHVWRLDDDGNLVPPDE
jgi:hypothetical protein